MKTVDAKPTAAAQPISGEQLKGTVQDVLDSTEFIDIHTHLFPPQFGGLGLWGIDELLTDHYMEAELFRFSGVAPEQYWKLNKAQRADLVWKTLFVENFAAVRGNARRDCGLACLGTQHATLEPIREFYRGQNLEDHL